jgi:hypothetical protein
MGRRLRVGRPGCGDGSESSPLAADRPGDAEGRQPRYAPDPARGHVDEQCRAERNGREGGIGVPG